MLELGLEQRTYIAAKPQEKHPLARSVTKVRVSLIWVRVGIVDLNLSSTSINFTK